MAGWTSESSSNPGSYGLRNATSPTKQTTVDPNVAAPSSGRSSSVPATRPGGSTPSSPTSSPDFSSLISALQNQNKTAAPAPAPLVNTSTPNPTADTAISALMSRAQGGMGADTAIRLAQGSTRDMLSGTLKEIQGGAARRGVGGSGAEGLQKGTAATKAQQQMAGQASNIAYGAEQDRNKLLGSTADLALSADAAQNEQRRIGLSQWQAQQQVGLEQQRINQAKDDRLLNILTQALF